jgi:hypothetical protein
MKNRFSAWLGVGLVLAAGPAMAQANLVNGSFESWSLVGWDFHTDVGMRLNETTQRPAGLAQTANVWGDTVGLVPAQTALDGNRFLLLRTRAVANFAGNNDYNFFVSQNFTLNPGDSISGLAAFWDGDVAQLDSAWVRIFDANLNLVATPWAGTPTLTTQTAPAGVSTSLDWALWEWESVTGGDYLVQLGMSTSGANNNSSFALFDAITLGEPASIPEPSSMVLALLGGVTLLVLRQRRH